MSYHLRVNPIDCTAHGMCAELLPERVELDDWGYPMIDDRPLSASLIEYARMAAATCPMLAIRLEEQLER